MNKEWFSKNKIVIVLALALGGFAFYAWKTDLSFAKFFNKDTQVAPVGPQPPPVGPKTADEGDWRRDFENDRK